MTYSPKIKEIKLADQNSKNGLYEFLIYLHDGSTCRVYYDRYPQWKATHIVRLTNSSPCPVCRKDYICECMSKFLTVIEKQIEEHDLISSVL